MEHTQDRKLNFIKILYFEITGNEFDSLDSRSQRRIRSMYQRVDLSELIKPIIYKYRLEDGLTFGEIEKKLQIPYHQIKYVLNNVPTFGTK